MASQEAPPAGPSDQHVHVIFVTDDRRATEQCIATMPLCWERQGSFIASNDLGGTWAIDGYKFYNLMQWRRAPPDPGTGQATMPAPADRFDDISLIFKQGRASRRRGIGKLMSREVEITTYHLLFRILMPATFAEYRVAAEAIAAEFAQMQAADRQPTGRLLLGLTDISLDRPIDPRTGSGIDQILNPSTLPDLMQALSGAGEAVPSLGIAVSGFERIFADFFALVRGRGRGYLAALPWNRHTDAFSAAADPEVMRPLLDHVIMTRPHLRNLLHNRRIFRPAAARLGVTPIMTCGFLDSPFRCVNYDPMTDRWLRGDPGTMTIRHEGEAKEVIPYASCDPLLTALFGVRTPMQFMA